MATDTLKRLYGPAQLPAAAATLYTVPAATTAVLRHIRVLNTTGTDRAVTMSIGADAAGTRFISMTVPANSVFDWTGNLPLAAGEIVQGFAAVAAALTAIISGIETA